MRIQRNILLKNYTTFKIGGTARYFCLVKSKKELIEAIQWAKKKNLPFFILGGGSNLLVSDRGYEGLVIKTENENLKMKNGDSKFKIIESESGVKLNQIVNLALQNSLQGLEWAAGIPGTLGGAIWGNAGSFGCSMAEVIDEVEVLDLTSKEKNFFGQIRFLKNKDCQFGYRESLFRRNKNLIILGGRLKLKKGKKEEIQNEIQEYLQRRKENLPLTFPSAGSIFKNPKNHLAVQLIESCNLKGKTIGQAKISEIHANFIVNLGQAKAGEVLKLISLIKEKVKKKFGIELEEEIKIIS